MATRYLCCVKSSASYVHHVLMPNVAVLRALLMSPIEYSKTYCKTLVVQIQNIQ